MYAVIFCSTKSTDAEDYGSMADLIADRAAAMPGFIRMESVRDASRKGITVCYWDSLEAINGWKNDIEHLKAQEMGKERWYEHYSLTVAKVEYEYSSKKR